MRYILFPGRHHCVTRFQISHLRGLQRTYPEALIVWAITSADHGGTQRNPIPGERRLGLVEAVTTAEQLPSLTFLITNRTPKPDFAHFVIEEIRTQTGGGVSMMPDNTVVACSTPAVIADYERLGFTVDTVELSAQQTRTEQVVLRPWDVVELMLSRGIDDPQVIAAMSTTTREYYLRYGLAADIARIHSDPLIDSDDGDITITRDYASYRAAFEDNAWRKVNDFAHLVRPGRIVDVGCATGQTIKLLSERPEFFESDFYGVEVARPLYEMCVQRAANGEFGNANVFFHQRNILQTQLFEPNTLDTVITMALTHEIESYLGREALLEFCERMYSILRPGGVWINYDVVGPQDGHESVLARFTRDDGSASGDLADLSSHARFAKFAEDFRREEGDGITFREVQVAGENYVELSRADLYEFLAKKDYINSWYSEAHERFCFFSPTDWVQLLEHNGFRCTPDTRPIRNPWLIDNRFAPAAQVFQIGPDGGLQPDEWSWTNVLLVAEKPTE